MRAGECLPVLVAASLVFIGVAAASGPAFAYRPFDGTDAAVAEPGELEVELQPVGVQQEQGTRTLIAPWTVLNFGLSEEWAAHSSSTSWCPEACRTRVGRALRPSSACCSPTAPATAASVQAGPESSRSAGIGERSTSTPRRR